MGTKVSKCCKCTNRKTEKYLNGGNSSWTTDDGSKDGEVLPPEPTVRRKMKHAGNIAQLALDSVQKQDAGVYTISARTTGGSASRDVELRVTMANQGDAESPTFLRRLNDLSVKIGTRTRLLVEIRSPTETTIDWFHSDIPAKEGERFRLINEGGFHCVDIAPLLAQDAGRWTCRVTNDAGTVSSTAYLNVLVPKTYKPPEFLEELKIFLTEAGTVSLECKVVGIPTPLLKWFKDGREIKAGDVFALNANHKDETTLGIYTCEAVNCMGTAYSSSKIHVVGSREGSLKPTESVPIGPPPIFDRHLQDEFVKIGDTFTLSCQVRVPPWPISVTWYNSEGKINDSYAPNSRYHTLADGLGEYLMEVKSAEAADAGEWKCVAASVGGASAVSICTIKMAIPKHYRKPKFMDNLKAILTDEGLVSFECKVVGSPTPSLRWFKDGQELKPGDVYQLSGTNSLGSYSCIATNCMGEAISTAELTVEDIQTQLNDEERQHLIMKSQAPKFLHGLKSCDGKINENFRFVVQVSIAPMPKLTWYRDDHAVEIEPERYLMKVDASGTCHLDISRLEFVDQAEWKCIASNEFGHTMTSCFLKLIVPKHFKKPRFLECLRAVLSEEGAVNLECKVIGVPQPVLKWYKDGQELKPGDIHKITSGVDGTCCLGTYTCEARNCMGTVSSSASLLGFDEQAKSRAQQHHEELARVPSLSTIHEERTSEIYDTPPQGDNSSTVNDHGEITFSFDGKEASVSLYETPDISEEEAYQIIEMYADQLSEHVSAQSIVEMPPMQFVKETSMSGNLIMEAVLVDVSEEYFASAQEDLPTEADVDEVFSISDDSRPFSPECTGSDSHPKRPPRKKNGSSKSAYYSLTNSGTQYSENGDESIVVAADLDSESNDYQSAMSSGKRQDAFQVAAITETTSLPGDDLDSRHSISPQTTHEIGSDLRVNRVEDDKNKLRKRIRSRHSARSSTESRDFNKGDAFARDLQGEEEDGLVIDPEEQKAKIAQLMATARGERQKLREIIIAIQEDLLNVEEDVLIQSSLKSTSQAANKSLEVLQSIAQPIKDIQMFLVSVEQHQSSSHQFIAEMIGPPIFDLQKNLNIVEKCVELHGGDHTLIQRTCLNILNMSSDKLQSGLKLIENITNLEKEMIPVMSPGRQTPSKITQEVLITLQELQASLNKAHFITEAKKHLKEKDQMHEAEGAGAKNITTIIMKFAEPALELKSIINNTKEEILAKDDINDISKENALSELSLPVQIMAEELRIIENQAIKFTGSKSAYKELHYAILDQISTPIYELQRHLQDARKESLQGRAQEIERIQLLESPLEDIFDSLTRLSINLPADRDSRVADAPGMSKQEVVKEVLDQVAQLVVGNICLSVQELLFNLDAAQKVVSESHILEVLRQLSSLQKDFAHLVNKVGTTNIEHDVLALENLVQPIEMLNAQILEVPRALPRDVLDDIIACLSIIEDTVDFDKTALTEISRQLFDTLKKRTQTVKDNILMIASDSKASYQPNESADEEEAVAKLIELKKCIAIVSSTPLMMKDEVTSIHSEDIKKLVESVDTIEETLESIPDPTKFEVNEKLEVEVFQSAKVVISAIKEIKERTSILSSIAAGPITELEDVSELRTLLHPLAELSSIIQKVEIQEDPMVALEIPIVELQKAMDTSKFEIDTRKMIINCLKNAMEIISIERNNSDIQKQHILELLPAANILHQFAQDMSKETDFIKQDIKSLKQQLQQLSADSPIKYIAMAVNDVSNTIQRALQQLEVKMAKESTAEPMAKFEENLAKLEASPSFENKQVEIEKLKSTVQDIRPLLISDPEARKSFENLVSFAQDVTKRSVIFEEASRKACVVVAELQESASLSSSTEELSKIQHALVKVFEVPPEVMMALTPIKDAIADIEAYPVKETHRALMENIQDALVLLKISIDKCALKSLSKKDIVLLDHVADTLHNIMRYIKQEITSEVLRDLLTRFNQELDVADVDTIKEVLYPVQNLTVQAQHDLLDFITAERARRTERAALISAVSNRAQQLVQLVATIKSPRVERSNIIEVQKALYSLQMCANDLIDESINEENRLLLQKVVQHLDVLSENIMQPPTIKPWIQTGLQATLTEDDRQPKINAVTVALNGVLFSAPLLIEQIGQGYRDAAKMSLVETKFTLPIEQLAHAQNPNQVLNEYLTDIQTNARQMLQTALSYDEEQYLRQIEDYAQTLGTIVSATDASNVKEAVQKIEEITEEVVLVGDKLQESPLRNLPPSMKKMCKIVIQVLQPVCKEAEESVQEVSAPEDTREVLYYLDGTATAESAELEQVEITAVGFNVFQSLLSIVDSFQQSMASLLIRDDMQTSKYSGISSAVESIRDKIQDNAKGDVKSEQLTVDEHTVMDLSKQLIANMNTNLPLQQVSISLKENVEELNYAARVLEDSSAVKEIAATIVHVAEMCIRAARAQLVQTQPIFFSLKDLEMCVKNIEHYQVPDEKRMGLEDLNNCIVSMQQKLVQEDIPVENLSQQEQSAMEQAQAALTTLTVCIHSSDVAESTAENKSQLMEKAKTIIDELRLAIVALPRNSAVKHFIGSLEETAKNVVNLIENIPEISGFIDTYDPLAGLQTALKETAMTIEHIPSESIASSQLNILKDIAQEISSLENELISFKILTPEDTELVNATELLVTEFRIYLQNPPNPNFSNPDSSKSQGLLNAIRVTRNIIESIPPSANAHNLGGETNKFIIDILKLIEKPEVSASAKVLPKQVIDMQDSVQLLQDSIAQQTEQRDPKVQRIVFNELPRPLTALQFIAENVIIEKSEKLSKNDLHLVDLTSECVALLDAALNPEASEDAVGQYEILESKLKVILASVNQESQIKDLQEPLQDISRTVAKVLERERVLSIEQVSERRSSLAKLQESLNDLSKIIARVIEQPDVDDKLQVLEELQKPLRAIISCPVEDIQQEEIETVRKLNDSAESISKTIRERATACDVDRSIQSLYETIVNIPIESTAELPLGRINFVQSISSDLKELGRAIELSHMVLEKPQPVEDIRQIHIIQTPLQNLLKFVLTIKHQREGNLDLFSILQDNLYLLQCKLLHCDDANLVEDEVPFLQTIGNAFNSITSIASQHDTKELDLGMFSVPLELLQSNIITICTKVVLTDIPEESLIQKIVELLEKITDGIIYMNTCLQERNLVKKTIENIVENIEQITDMWQGVESLSDMVCPLQDIAFIIKTHKYVLTFSQQELCQFTRELEEIQENCTRDKSINDCLKMIGLNAATLRDNYEELDELQKAVLLAEPIAELLDLMNVSANQNSSTITPENVVTISTLSEGLPLDERQPITSTSQKSLEQVQPLVDIATVDKEYATKIQEESQLEQATIQLGNIEKGISSVNPQSIAEIRDETEENTVPLPPSTSVELVKETSPLQTVAKSTHIHDKELIEHIKVHLQLIQFSIERIAHQEKPAHGLLGLIDTVSELQKSLQEQTAVENTYLELLGTLQEPFSHLANAMEKFTNFYETPEIIKTMQVLRETIETQSENVHIEQPMQAFKMKLEEICESMIMEIDKPLQAEETIQHEQIAPAERNREMGAKQDTSPKVVDKQIVEKEEEFEEVSRTYKKTIKNLKYPFYEIHSQIEAIKNMVPDMKALHGVPEIINLRSKLEAFCNEIDCAPLPPNLLDYLKQLQSPGLELATVLGMLPNDVDSQVFRESFDNQKPFLAGCFNDLQYVIKNMISDQSLQEMPVLCEKLEDISKQITAITSELQQQATELENEIDIRNDKTEIVSSNADLLNAKKETLLTKDNINPDIRQTPLQLKSEQITEKLEESGLQAGQAKDGHLEYVITEQEISQGVIKLSGPLETLKESDSKKSGKIANEQEPAHSANIAETFEKLKEVVTELKDSQVPEVSCISQLEGPIKTLIGSLNELEAVQNEYLEDFEVVQHSVHNVTATLVEIKQLSEPIEIEAHKVRMPKALLEIQEITQCPHFQKICIVKKPLLAIAAEVSNITEVLMMEMNRKTAEVSVLPTPRKAKIEFAKLPIEKIHLKIKTLQPSISCNIAEPQQAIYDVVPLEELKANIESIDEQPDRVSQLEIIAASSLDAPTLIREVITNLHSPDEIEIKVLQIEKLHYLKQHIQELRFELNKEQCAKICDLKLEALCGILDIVPDKQLDASVQKVKCIFKTLGDTLDIIPSRVKVLKLGEIEFQNAITFLREIQQNITPQGADLESMKQLEIPVQEFSAAVMNIGKSDDVNSGKLLLFEAVAALSKSIKNMEASHPKFNELLRAFTDELSKIQAVLQKKEKITLAQVNTPLIALQQKIVSLRDNPRTAAMFTIGLESPLQGVISYVQQADEAQEEQVCNTLKGLRQPLEKLVHIVDQVTSVLEQPETVKASKGRLCSEIALIVSDVEKTECMNALAMKIEGIQYDLHRAEVAYNVQPILHELADLQVFVSNVHHRAIAQELPKPNEALLEVAALAETLVTIQNDFKQLVNFRKCSEQECIATDSLKEILEPMKQLNMMKTQVSELTTVKVKKELINSASSVMTAIANVNDGPQKLEAVQIPLKKLNGVLSSLQEIFSKEIDIDKATKSLQSFKLSIESLQGKMHDFQLKSVDNVASQKGVLSLLIIEEPLQIIHNMIQQQLRAPELSCVSQQLANLSIVQEPLANLGQTIGNVANLMHEPRLLQAEKNTILKGLQAVKNALITEVSKLQPVEELKLKIEEVEKVIELMEYKPIPIKSIVDLSALGTRFENIENHLKKFKETAITGDVYHILSGMRKPSHDCLEEINNTGDVLVDKSDVNRISNNFQHFDALQNGVILLDKCINDLAKESPDALQKSTILRDILRNLSGVLVEVQCNDEFARISSSLNYLSGSIVNVLKNLATLDIKQRIQIIVLESSGIIEVVEKSLNIVRDGSKKLVKMLFGKWETPLKSVAQCIHFTVDDAPENVIGELNKFIPICNKIVTLIETTCDRIDDNEDGKLLKKTLKCVQDNCEALAAKINYSSKNNEIVDSISLMDSAMSKLYEALIATKFAEEKIAIEEEKTELKVDDEIHRLVTEADKEKLTDRALSNTVLEVKEVAKPLPEFKTLNNERAGEEEPAKKFSTDKLDVDINKKAQVKEYDEKECNEPAEKELKMQTMHERTVKLDNVIPAGKAPDLGVKGKCDISTTQEKLAYNLQTDKESMAQLGIQAIIEKEKIGEEMTGKEAIFKAIVTTEAQGLELEEHRTINTLSIKQQVKIEPEAVKETKHILNAEKVAMEEEVAQLTVTGEREEKEAEEAKKETKKNVHKDNQATSIINIEAREKISKENNEEMVPAKSEMKIREEREMVEDEGENEAQPKTENDESVETENNAKENGDMKEHSALMNNKAEDQKDGKEAKLSNGLKEKENLEKSMATKDKEIKTDIESLKAQQKGEGNEKIPKKEEKEKVDSEGKQIQENINRRNEIATQKKEEVMVIEKKVTEQDVTIKKEGVGEITRKVARERQGKVKPDIEKEDKLDSGTEVKDDVKQEERSKDGIAGEGKPEELCAENIEEEKKRKTSTDKEAKTGNRKQSGGHNKGDILSKKKGSLSLEEEAMENVENTVKLNEEKYENFEVNGEVMKLKKGPKKKKAKTKEPKESYDQTVNAEIDNQEILKPENQRDAEEGLEKKTKRNLEQTLLKVDTSKAINLNKEQPEELDNMPKNKPDEEDKEQLEAVKGNVQEDANILNTYQIPIEVRRKKEIGKETYNQDKHKSIRTKENTISQPEPNDEVVRNRPSPDLLKSDQIPELNDPSDTAYFSERRGRSPVRERIKLTDTEVLSYDYEDKFKPSRKHNRRFNQRKPIFSTPLAYRTATSGTRLKLSCHVLSTEEITMEWFKDSCQISSDNNYITSYKDGICSLEILNANVKDTAEYTCAIRNSHGANTTKAKLKVYEGFDATPIAPTFTRQIREQFRYSSKELILECRLRANPTPSITWYKDGAILSPSDRFKQYYLADGICKLVIFNPGMEDTGCYSCRAENNCWSDQISHYFYFNDADDYISQRSERWHSSCKSTLDSRRPQLGNILTDAYIPTGCALALQVEVRGSPTEVKWYKGGEELPKASDRYTSNVENGVYTLFFPSALDADKGMYTFKAQNPYGNIETSAYVDIVDPRQVHDGKPAMFKARPDMDLLIATGEDITVSFRLCGDPKPNVTLMKGMKDVTNSHRCLKFTLDDYQRFSIKRATEDDAGTYCILAKNRFGCDRAFFTVKLRQRSRSASPFQLMRTVPEILDGIPRYWECNTLRDVPAPISSPPTVVDTGKNWVSLRWGKPDPRVAAPVLAYKIDAWQKGGEARWIELGVTPMNGFDAFNLSPNAEYKFRVTARNRYGWGEPVQSDPIVIGHKVELPEFTQTLCRHSKALLGADFAFEARIKDVASAQIRWYKDSTELNSSDDSRIALKYENGVCTCTIRSVCFADAARYSCEAVSHFGRVASFGRLAVVTDPQLLLADEHLKQALEDSSMDGPPQFTMHLRDRRVQASYPVRLTCQVAGHPVPIVLWSKDGVVLADGSNRVTWSENSFHTLEFFKTSLDDAGVYGAIAKNEFGSVSCRCQLFIDQGIKAYAAPKFKSACSPAEVHLSEGEQLYLFACVEAHPTVNVVWYRNGMRLRASRKTVSTLSHDGRIELSVGSTTMADAGVYTCVATNEIGRAETVARVDILDKFSKIETQDEAEVCEGDNLPYSKEPMFLTKPTNTVASEGDDVVIFCEVVGDPKPEVFWLRDFLKPEYYKDAAHFRRVGAGCEYRLEIPHAKLDHTGAYTVLARNCHGEAKAIISLQIKVEHASSEGSRLVRGRVQTVPTIVAPLKDIRCCDADSVAFECRVRAAPPASVRWERDGRIVRLGGAFAATLDGEAARLLIADVCPEDEGEYSCVASNDLGKATTSACLIVDVPEARETILSKQRLAPATAATDARCGRIRDRRPRPSPPRPPRPPRAHGRCVPPTFFAMPRIKIADEGATVRFQCAVGGHPEPWTTWDKDERVFVSGGRVSVQERDDVRILEIRDVVASDAGAYRVRLENDVGRAEAVAKLDVLSHQIPRGAPTRHLRALSAPNYSKIYTSNRTPLPSQTKDSGMAAPRVLRALPARWRCASRTQVVLTAQLSVGRQYDVVWMKDGCVLPDSPQFRHQDDRQGGVQLVIPCAYVIDSGDYRCEVYNVFGEATTACRLEVVAA